MCVIFTILICDYNFKSKAVQLGFKSYNFCVSTAIGCFIDFMHSKKSFRKSKHENLSLKYLKVTSVLLYMQSINFYIIGSDFTFGYFI